MNLVCKYSCYLGNTLYIFKISGFKKNVLDISDAIKYIGPGTFRSRGKRAGVGTPPCGSNFARTVHGAGCVGIGLLLPVETKRLNHIGP